MVKIAMGLGSNNKVIDAVNEVSDDITLVKTEKELLNCFYDSNFDAIIRGSLSSKIIVNLRKDFPEIFRASILEHNGKLFFLAPVGIDEGDSIDDKIKIIENCSNILQLTGHIPHIAILSNGRKQDIGRSNKIDKSIIEAEEITNNLKDKYDIKHYYILLEEALKDNRNIIIATDGIIGNIIFRSLVLIGNTKSYGALTMPLPKIFIDTSRSQTKQGYLNAIKLTKN
ncbi:MAG: methanogenesis marker protein Mmp4/MtxX, partial [Methanobacteriaceae archaeon]|nr:methanogenesis marker protein Mmp4/MtxX [Methanobacteriaceae archaeon]